MNDYSYLTEDCLVCGIKLFSRNNKFSNAKTFFCKNSSKYYFNIGGNSHYEVIYFNDYSLNIFITLDSMRWKILGNDKEISLLENKMVRNILHNFSGDVRYLLKNINFDLIEFLKTNTKVELIDKLQTMLVFQ